MASRLARTTLFAVAVGVYVASSAARAGSAPQRPPVAPSLTTVEIPQHVAQDDRQDEDLPFGSRGGIAVRHQFPVDGEYSIKVQLRRQDHYFLVGMGWPQQLDVRLDGKLIRRFIVGGSAPGTAAAASYAGGSQPGFAGSPDWVAYMQVNGDASLEVRVPVAAGPRVVGVSFVRELWEPEGLPQPLQHGPVLTGDQNYMGYAAVGRVGISGPYRAIPAMPQTASRIGVIEAAKHADRAGLRALIEQEADVNAAAADGATALHWAAYRDDQESVELLIRAGARVDAATEFGVTPLWNASMNAGAAIVKRLLDAGANPNLALPSGETPLMLASRSGKADVVALLLARGADANARASRLQTALMWAAAQRHPEVVKLLLAHGADVQARTVQWQEMMAVPPHGLPQYNRIIPHGRSTALLFAARSGDLESAKLLVAAGANVSDANAWGVSATTMAAHAGFTELVEWLLDRGADANAALPGFGALHVAIMRRDTRMVTALLAHGADADAPLRTWTPKRRSSHDFNFPPELVGATPFWLAARFNEPDAMRLLLKHGANAAFVHRGDYHNEEPIEPRTQITNAVMAATGMGGGVAWVQPDRAAHETLMLESVGLAADHGSDLNARNVDGRTALDAARALKFERVAAFLVERGARAGRTGK